MPKKWRMTQTELRLKRERMVKSFKAGKDALVELGLSYFLVYGSALGALREGEFQPHEDDINVGIYQWDLAQMQRQCGDPSPAGRDARMVEVFNRLGFDPVKEMMQNPPPQHAGEEARESGEVNACPRMFITESWTDQQAYPILYKFTHRESLVRFDVIVFAMQFGCLWDFADGGAETSSGWRYSLFSPQPIEFERLMTFTMPAKALAEHYGENWHVPRATGYIENLALCINRCQILRVHPWDVEATPKPLPAALPWSEFKSEVKQYRIRYAKSLGDEPFEAQAKPLDLFKIECKPLTLFEAAGVCKEQGNSYLTDGKPRRALERYDEGLYIADKAREVLLTWRVLFRQAHNEKAEEDRKRRGLDRPDMLEPEVPLEFRSDEETAQGLRLAFFLNAAQAALRLEEWDTAESRTGSALEIDPKNAKALYRRGNARVSSGRQEAAKADFLALLRATTLDNRDALQPLLKLMPKEELEKELRRMKSERDRQERLGRLIKAEETDERVAIQDERYERYLADCEQRREDRQKEITFDDWVDKYEWRYDAEERQKVRQRWPAVFNRAGPAPLPVEEWEVDYLTHKEIDKIMYHRQTAALGESRRLKEGPKPPAPEREGYICKLEVDEEDESILRNQMIAKGYHYWW